MPRQRLHARFFSHEFAHHVQLERAGYPNGHMRMPGGWYAEGMAQCLSYWASSLAIGPKDIRAYALSNLAREASKSGITRVDMSTVDTDPNGELKYAT